MVERNLIMSSHNLKRTEEDVKREISMIIRGLKDPRIDTMLSVTRCELSNDKSFCKIYISCLGGEESIKESIIGLEKASGFIKKELNSKIKMRVMPELKFIPDNSLEYYTHINKILDNLNIPSDEDGSFISDDDSDEEA